MKRLTLRGRRYYLSSRYNVILLTIYALILAVVMLGKSSSQYKRNLMMFLMIAIMIMSMLRLFGVAKHLRFLDLMLTCAFGVMLIGHKLKLPDIQGFFIVVLIGFLTMCVGGPFAWIAGIVILTPALCQIYEKWQVSGNYWFEIMLCFCLVMMLIGVGLPHHDYCEVMFLFFSFLSKMMILVFVTSDFEVYEDEDSLYKFS
jgi:hypothetical protein